MHAVMERKRWRSVRVVFVMLLQLWQDAVAYNLDTKFPVIYSSSLGDYFGYTVALHKNKNGPMALVGAPRANSTILLDPVHQPGVLFKCDIPPSSSVDAECEEITLYTKGNTDAARRKDFSYHDKKDDMWLGVSLDIQQHQAQNDIVTCGHLWKNQNYRGEHLVNGVCYVINSDLDPSSVIKLMPLIQRSNQQYRSDTKMFYYAYGQAGTSAAYSEDGKSLILGAPGLCHWNGSVVSYPIDPKNSKSTYKNPAVPDPPDGLSPDSYLGYSVTSGRFFDNDDTFYAVGAPRDSGNYGRVYMFKAPEQKNIKLAAYHKEEGTQFGEYFGATVLGINLNGDTYTDLLVAAPFHSLQTGGDEGKVVIYLSNGVGLETYAELFGDIKANARFGTAIANADDLNQDGFIDVAIGAPYEDEKGAVYIYHGAETGMNVQYAQKIKASSISPSLTGFGIHISRGVDIDSNQYPDILIGSYASSNAVLFRTRPVVQLFPKLILSPKHITNLTDCIFNGKKLRCVNISACLSYEGKHAPPSLDFENDIFVEAPSETNFISLRGYFVHNRKQVSMISGRTKLEIGVNKCIKNVLYIHSDVKDIITPIQIVFRYRLIESPEADVSFNNLFPVIHPSTPTNVTSAITFQTGCSGEDKCLSDLVVSAILLGAANGQLTLGEVSSVSLSVTVRNRGDSAYLSELLIYLPTDMPIINQDFCGGSSQHSNASLVCKLGNPLLNNAEIKILIKMDVTQIPTDRKKLDIFLDAVTISTETTPEDNTLSIPLHLLAIADIGVTGASAPEQFLYDEDEHFGIPIITSHTYTVRNHGPSPLQMIDIIIRVPIALLHSAGRMQFLTFTSLEADSGKQLTIPAQCNSTYLNLTSAKPDVKTQVQAATEDELLAENSTRPPLYNHSREFVDKPTNVTTDHDDSNLVFHSKKNSKKTKAAASNARQTILIVRNHGPSPLQMIDIIIRVPIALLHSAGRMQFLTFTSLEADSGKQLTIPAQCNSTYLNLTSAKPDVKTQVQAATEDELLAENSTRPPLYNHSREFVDKPTNVTTDHDDSNLVFHSKKNSKKTKAAASNARQTILINCDNKNIECIAIQCSTSPFTDTRKIAQITVTAEVNLTIISTFLGPWYKVELVTAGEVTMRDDNIKQLSEYSDIAQVKTVFIQNGVPPPQEVPLWIILVSIFSGILLLVIILLLLIKIGFFKRKSTENSQELIDGDHNKYGTLEDESTENYNLN